LFVNFTGQAFPKASIFVIHCAKTGRLDSRNGRFSIMEQRRDFKKQSWKNGSCQNKSPAFPSALPLTERQARFTGNRSRILI
jgi:hypothetical protein